MAIQEMKIKAKQGGGHMHVQVFSRIPPTETWAKCGTLCMDVGMWQIFGGAISMGAERTHGHLSVEIHEEFQND